MRPSSPNGAVGAGRGGRCPSRGVIHSPAGIRPAAEHCAYGGDHAGAGRAVDEAAAGRRPLAARLSRKELGTPVVAAAVAAVAALGADLAYGTGGGPALAAGAAALVAGAAAAVVKLTAGHLPAAHRQAG